MFLLYLVFMVPKQTTLQPSRKLARQVTCSMGQGYVRCTWIDPGMHPAGSRYCVMGDYVIVYLVRGSAIVTHDQQQFEFNPGDLFFRPPGIPHYVVRPQPHQWLSFAVALSCDVYESLKQFHVLPDELTIVHAGIGDAYLNPCKQLARQIQLGQHQQPRTLLYQILGWLEAVSGLSDMSEAQPGIPAKIRQAAGRLTQAYDQPIDLQYLAEHLGMGYEHFRKVFTRYMGKSPMAYRITHRIHHAQNRLLETEVSISELAEQLGYADVYTFSRQFKQITGQSPTAYRNQVGLLPAPVI
jgi:AraC-like DNA-binding protein